MCTQDTKSSFIWLDLCEEGRRIEINGFGRFALAGGILDCTAYGVPPPKVTWLRLNPEAALSEAKNSPVIDLASNIEGD